MPKTKAKIKEKTEEIADTSNDANAEERRLFYVALTRAKKGVTISYARENDDGREQLPSSFIGEIKPELIEKVDTEAIGKDYLKNRDIFFRHATPVSGIEDHRAFVTELFRAQGFSPTALNNYLECPWKYFYINLIRIPKAPEIPQAYGIAVHHALQDFFKRIKEEETGKDFLLESFEGYLNRQSIPPGEVVLLREKGIRSLGGWYDAYAGTWNLNCVTEYRINGVLIAGDIKLTGVLDKLEFVNDNLVNVVDYKTGKPKTRNEILGKTRSADGNYYRQMTFYKLLLSHYNDGKLSMHSGTLDFIEPDDSGKYRKEEFEITDEEVRELTALIQKTAEEIITLSFWNERCNEKKCEYCKLRDLIVLS